MGKQASSSLHSPPLTTRFHHPPTLVMVLSASAVMEGRSSAATSACSYLSGIQIRSRQRRVGGVDPWEETWMQ